MPRGTATKGYKETQNRQMILDILSSGPIVDKGGLAIQQLQAKTGHESSNALTKVLRNMEDLGLITREVRGRRTFRIESTAPTIEDVTDNVASLLERDVRAPEPEPTWDGDGEIDYEVLGAVLVKMAYKNLEAAATPAELADLRRRYLAAEARAAEATDQLSAVRAERDELAERARIAEQNQKTLMAQMDKPRRGGATVREMISPAERREMDKLMRQIPSRRG